jgi:hypothetical protein
MNKYVFMLIMIPAIAYILYYWYLAWFHPRLFGAFSENHRRKIVSLYPKFMKNIIYFVTGNPYSSINKWDARFVITIILFMALFGFSAIFWSSTFK